MRRLVLTGFFAVGLLASGCQTPADDSTGPSPTNATTPTPLPTRDRSTVQARCLVDVPGDIGAIASEDGASSLGAVVHGSGDTAVVLLHQTGSAGLCGWVTYARWLASQGVLALAVDDCTHGPSRCAPEVADDARAMVAVAVDAARARGAERVAVVGASMGGARALGVGQAAGADVVVDLSGPATWEGVPDALTAARATTVPLLVVASIGDRGIDAEALEAAVDASPARPKRFLEVPGRAHGWRLTMDGITAEATVTEHGRLVLDWVRQGHGGSGQG